MSSQPLSLSPQSGSPGLSTCLSVPGGLAGQLGHWVDPEQGAAVDVCPPAV